MSESLTADYLVVGAGAMGMAFVDTLISDSNATVIMIDRYHRPGGHWTIAYPYVRLHQPSAFYGVNSRKLGRDELDEVGWNKGLFELATRDEVCAYYNLVMDHTFLPSGRVKYFPKHEYVGEGGFYSTLTGKKYHVGENTRIVDATFMKVRVPSMSPPQYQIDDGINIITPNNLPSVNRPHANYTVVGAGKTGVDACLWLLSNGIDPEVITWIVPRDPYFLERGAIQPGTQFKDNTQSNLNKINGSIMAATSIDDLLDRLVECQQLLRLNDNVRPTMFRCSTVSLAEFEQLQKLKNIVRKGRVRRLSPDEVTLQQGSYKPITDTLFIDCSADALAKLAPVPVFRGNNITLQSVRYCQQVFSASFIAHAECAYADEGKKNYLCRPIPHPYEGIDFPLVQLQSHLNGMRWNKEPKTFAWLKQARLDWFGTFSPPVPEDPEQAKALFTKLGAQIEALVAQLRKLLGELPEKNAIDMKEQMERFEARL